MSKYTAVKLEGAKRVGKPKGTLAAENKLRKQMRKLEQKKRSIALKIARADKEREWDEWLDLDPLLKFVLEWDEWLDLDPT